MKVTFLLLLLLSINTVVSAATWHVSDTGNDANDGKAPETAFRNLQKAADLVQPGDVVLISNGTYTNAYKGNGSAVLNITRSGTPEAWITWKAGRGIIPKFGPSAGLAFRFRARIPSLMD